MSTLGATFPTLLDVTSRMDPNGQMTRVIAEVLSKKMPMLDDMVWQEGNLPDGHKFTARNSLPSLTWRKLNQGLNSTKSTTDQITETCGMLEGYSKVDVDEAAMAGNPAAFRASEDAAFVEAFNQQIASGFFYSNIAATPEQFQGLTPRLNASTAAHASTQLLPNAHGTISGTDQTSIWLVGWAPEKVFMTFPKGSVGGLTMEDLGKQLVLDSSSKQFLAWVTRWQWKVGVCVKDYRFVARSSNIDTGNWDAILSSGVFGNADLAMLMNDLMTAIYDLSQCKPVFYMARQTYNMLAKQLVARQANWLEMVQQPNGTRIPYYQGIPIKWTDSLTLTESATS